MKLTSRYPNLSVLNKCFSYKKEVKYEVGQICPCRHRRLRLCPNKFVSKVTNIQ